MRKGASMSLRRACRVVVAAITLSCAGCGGQASNPIGPAPSPQACRTYATAWDSTSTFGSPDTSSASFDAVSHIYTETSPAGSGQVVRRTLYASTADFIDEPAILGRVLYSRRESCAGVRSCAGGLLQVETPTYDNQRRLTGMMLSIAGTPLSVETYSQWDAKSRPTAGTRSQPGLCVLPIVLMYDEAARTVAVAPTGSGVGVLCLGVYYSTQLGYDADGNLISEGAVTGGTGTAVTHTITAKAQLCK